MQRPGRPGWGLDARLTTLLCKKIIVAKSKEVKTAPNLAESSKKAYGSERAMMIMNDLRRICNFC
jgi:hypothetical protein